jgi:hypothetical protein
MMFQAFIDDSGWEEKSPVFVLAGYVATAAQWESFSREWQAVLDLEAPKKIAHFTMNEAQQFEHRHSQFYGFTEAERDARLIKLGKVINRQAGCGIVSVIPIEQYRRLFGGKFGPAVRDRPYFLSLFGMMTSLIKLLKTPDDRIDFIFDTLDEHSKTLLLAHYERYVALAPAQFRGAGPALPKFAREEDCLPLQAADMIAWHVRRHYWDAHLGRDTDPSNADLADLLKTDHDILDRWNRERLEQASAVLLKSLEKAR